MENLTDEQRSLFHSGGSIDQYEVIKPIGKGKFSVVYRARCTSSNRLVALKRIGIFDLMNAKAREKTLKEVRLVQSLAHPHLIEYLDAFLDGNELCIIFEWAEAGDLKRQIRKANEKHATFDERVIWKYFGQLVECLRYLHHQRVMHRDLKPANIFLTSDGQVKLGDLGLGRHVSENTLEVHSKVGTPLYMSPQILEGRGYDWKCDIWSLGCILYELAMLKSPFKSEGLDLYGLCQKIQRGDFAPVSTSYSPELQELVTDMIALDPQDRPGINQVYAVVLKMRDVAASESSSSLTPIQVPPEKRKKTTTNLPFILMDQIFDKLQLLGYPQLRQLSRYYFAMDGHQCVSRQEQFHQFCLVILWLVQKLERPDVGTRMALRLQEEDEDRREPLSLSREILDILNTLGLSPRDAQGLSPATIVPGFGFSVCFILNWSCDQVLQQFQWHAPVHHHRENYPDQAPVDEENVIEELEDFEFVDPEELSVVVAPCLEEEDVEQPKILISTIDPRAWKLECERVRVRLSSSAQNKETFSKPWSSHWMILQRQAQVLKTEQRWLLPHLGRVTTSLVQDINTLRQLESKMNTRFQDICDEYGTFSKKVQQLEACRRRREESLRVQLSTVEQLDQKGQEIESQVKTRSEVLSNTRALEHLRVAVVEIQQQNQKMSQHTRLLSLGRWQQQQQNLEKGNNVHRKQEEPQYQDKILESTTTTSNQEEL